MYVYVCISLSLCLSPSLSHYIYVCTYVYMYVCVYIYIYTQRMCVYTYIYTYIRIVYQMISLISHAINHFNTHSTFGRDGTGNTPWQGCHLIEDTDQWLHIPAYILQRANHRVVLSNHSVHVASQSPVAVERLYTSHCTVLCNIALQRYRVLLLGVAHQHSLSHFLDKAISCLSYCDGLVLIERNVPLLFSRRSGCLANKTYLD